jgi:hypothetical protein
MAREERESALSAVLFGERWPTAAWRAIAVFALGYVLPAMFLAPTSHIGAFLRSFATVAAFALTAAAVYKYLQLRAAPAFVLEEAFLEEDVPLVSDLHTDAAPQEIGKPPAPKSLPLDGLGQAALERLCIALYQFNGLDSRTVATGAEGAYRIRLVPRNTDKPIAILKCHAGADIQGALAYVALLRVMEEEALGKAFFVAPAGFTPEVSAEARARHVTLVDLKLLQAMLNHLPEAAREAVLATAA